MCADGRLSCRHRERDNLLPWAKGSLATRNAHHKLSLVEISAGIGHSVWGCRSHVRPCKATPRAAWAEGMSLSMAISSD